MEVSSMTRYMSLVRLSVTTCRVVLRCNVLPFAVTHCTVLLVSLMGVEADRWMDIQGDRWEGTGEEAEHNTILRHTTWPTRHGAS